MQLGCRIRERVVGGSNLHVLLAQLLGVVEVFGDVVGLHIQCLKGIERCIRLIGGGVAVDGGFVGGNRLLCAVEITIEHGALQHRLTRIVAVWIVLEQLSVGLYRRGFIFQLQLCTGYLIHTVVSVVRLRIASHQRLHGVNLIVVFA